MLKTILLCVTMFCICQRGFTQNDLDYNTKLLAKYSLSELKNIENNFPDSILFLNYIATKGYYIIDMPPKQISYELIENFSTDKLQNFNIFEYNVKFLENKNNYYKLGDTGKLLILVNMREIKQFSKQEKINAK